MEPSTSDVQRNEPEDYIPEKQTLPRHPQIQRKAPERLDGYTLLQVSMFKLFIESDYIENNLIYFNLNKGDVLIFNQSMKALSDHRINRCFDIYVIRL